MVNSSALFSGPAKGQNKGEQARLLPMAPIFVMDADRHSLRVVVQIEVLPQYEWQSSQAAQLAYFDDVRV
jgi:hypothetical protein